MIQTDEDRKPACPCCKRTADVRGSGPDWVCNHCDSDWQEPERIPHFDVVSRAPWYVRSNRATHHAWADRRDTR